MTRQNHTRWIQWIGAAGAAFTFALGTDAQVATAGGSFSSGESSVGSVAPARIDFREYQVPGKSSVARVWSERDAGTRQLKYFYELETYGKVVGPVQTSYDLKLLYKDFDPLRERAGVPQTLRASSNNELYIVQYWTQGIEDYWDTLTESGVEIHRYLANNANIVQMNATTAELVREMPFVRAVRPFHPAYKVDPELLAELEGGATGPVTVNLLTMRRGGQQPVADWVVANGGTVEHVSSPTYYMIVSLDWGQLSSLVSLNEVQWVDKWGPEEPDMNNARIMHGTNFVENQAGYLGTGVRVEVRDVGCQTTHPDLPNFILHGQNQQATHGTSTSGIVLGKGIGNANARGSMPNAFLIIRDISFAAPGGSRYAATGELQDPSGPYRAVLQSNSVGSPQILNYSSVSQNMDLILFDFSRISVCQSQSNTNSQRSRPEAWAKNVISSGGINHFDTVTKSDDRWGGASIGPAEDGRIKPDVSSYYDRILTTTTGSGYTTGFGGTSGATPINAGNLGIFYEMWHNGEFGNPTGTSVFDSRPQNTTAKAALINTAGWWDFSGTTHNLTRVHQGWGHANLRYMYENRNKMVIVDETDVLAPFETRNYFVNVAAGEDEFRATMVYRDPPGTTSSSLHRINDMDLVVLSPSGTVYKGNNGLDANNYSTPGGPPNTVDTVENVFVQNPEEGEWRVIVYAVQINADTHVETPALDCDYALVISGFQSETPACGTARNIVRNAGINQATYTADPIVIGQPATLTCDTQGFQFATFLGVVLPENRPLDSGYTALISPDTRIIFKEGPIAGPVAQAQVTINDPALCGLVVYSTVRLDNGPGTGFIVTNAVDFVVGN